eukprot:CAMPEP_0177701202 /NCGR_PEP_ID=MMETSP0484_2-20121128/6492_1 /TAXON_ID=354590 /ORGANISM="Rhodomonas lens, Strain RHODO" /LENGTH=314 /DNA_ID=CAMNT_0019212433 /DNA_START=66 /DNA_END=1010 /DNA_ORIENTATION=-
MTIAYFCVSGLDLLGELTEEDMNATTKWVLSLQIVPKTSTAPGGFRGSTFFAASQESGREAWDLGHIAMTYTALAVLKICKRGLEDVNVAGVRALVKAVQDSDGSFRPHAGECERDVRFLFCAAACCHLISDWRTFDKDRAVENLLSCVSHEGGFGLHPGLEAHGGSTYCSVAALALMGKLEALGPDRKERLVEWCLKRQVGGFQGRINKDADSCYSFWIGATLHMLGASAFVDADGSRAFSSTCESGRTGGFGKAPQARPDVLHTYMALSGFSLSAEAGSAHADVGLKTLCAPLGVTTGSAGDLFIPPLQGLV